MGISRYASTVGVISTISPSNRVAFLRPGPWAINTPRPVEKVFGKHPTQKPEELLKRVVLASTHKGQLVLDPFTGSSTTGLVAYLFGRKFIGIDNEKSYIDLSIKRYNLLKSNIRKKHSRKLEAVLK